jgi:hypothetical protein
MTTFVRSQRGSVLVAGMFMGVILVLCCLHMLGVCEAILLRALGQNIADAVALEGAVWHAQGMNLIVLINLILAAVLALFITIRLLQILFITAIVVLNIAAGIASFFSFGAGGQAALRPLIQAVTRALGHVQRAEDKVSEPVMKTLSYGAEAERLLAAVMPYVSLARPVTRGAGLPGLVVGVSLVPAVLEQKFSKAPQIPILQNPAPGGWNWETSFPARMGTLPLGPLNDRVKQLDRSVSSKGLPAGVVTEAVDLAKGVFGSLPVQEEDAYQLCARAGEMVTTFIPSVAGMNDAMLEKIGAFAGVVFGSLQTMTCTPLKQLGSVAENEMRKAVDKKCEEEEEEDVGFGIGQLMGDKPYWDKARRDKCRKDKLEQAQKDSGWKKPTSFDSLKIARLWGIIASPKSSPFLHVWSLVPLHRDGPKSRFHQNMKHLFGWDLDDAGVANVDVANPEDVAPADAEGEFRHVCDGGSDPAGRSCGENSMWRPGWYGKLVPVRDFTEELRQKLGDALAGWFSRALGKSIASVTDRFLQRFVPSASKPFIDELERHIGITLGQRMLNNWFNRRFLTDQITSRLGIQKIEALTVQDYPEYLH